jgi:hypothetical protein
VLTEVILARSEAYRFVLSTPGGAQWPPGRFTDWPEAVRKAGREWSAWTEDRCGPVPALVAGAAPGASWRAGLGIPQPSSRLAEAIERLSLPVRAATPPTGAPAFGAALAATTREDQPGEQELDALARRVLRSALEQLRIRHARNNTDYHQIKSQ